LRILVLDSSGILPWRIRHTLADAHEVIAAGSLEEAEKLAHARRPDAAVVSVPHSSLCLRSFHELCAGSSPSIPVLYESCLPGGLGALGIGRPNEVAPGPPAAALLPKPASQRELAEALQLLLEAAARLRAESGALSLAAPLGS
jgi:DNA-binding NarL/FixJ family response regulator